MKKGIIVLAIIFIAALALFTLNLSAVPAYAMEIEDVYVLTKPNNLETYTNYDLITKAYGRDIKIGLKSSLPRIRFRIYINSSGSYTETGTLYLVYTESSAAEFTIPISGDLMVRIEPQNANGTAVGVYRDIYVKNDSSAPPEPQVDLSILDTYYNSPFNIAYKLVADNESGIDYNRSKYYYKNFSNVVVKTGFFSEGGVGETRYISSIDQNGMLCFELYDLAGNKSEFTYAYTKFGLGVSEAPTVTFSTTDFAKSVTVTISWGAEYDASSSPKEYIITTLKDSKNYDYTGPFVIDTEGEVKIQVFYYKDGEKKSIVKTINNIDKTPPDQSILRNNIHVFCDLTADIPIYVRVKAIDSLSGVAKVYTTGDKVFTNTSADIYILDITGMEYITIFAEDKVGNVTSVLYTFPKYDYNTITEYNQKYKSANSGDYDIDGWTTFIKDLYNLGIELTSEDVSSTRIRLLKDAVDKSFAGEIDITSIIDEIPSGLSGLFSVDIDGENTTIKKGGKASIVLGKVNESQEDINNAKTTSGLTNGACYPFSLTLKNSRNEIAQVTGNVTVKIQLPSNTQIARILLKTDDGFKVLNSEVVDGYIIAKTSGFGEFYIVCIRSEQKNNGFIIGGKLYTYVELGVTAAIIVGTTGVAVLVVLIVSKRKKN